MESLPEIGAKVVYNGFHGQMTGIVQKIYPAYSETGRPVRMPFNPETWYASVLVDKVSDNWPYPGTNKFAPPISEIFIYNR